jgi:membrane associated rhomboid family serine protease|tara:strand:- start:944 stop:1684 length:741 start_codon:yes stop_codon:yes gene_type:complete
MGRITDTIKHLLIINVIFFFAKNQFGDALYDLFALHYFQNPLFEIWQPLTHMFMHGNFSHILFNMFGLYMFGSPLESLWGKKKFIFFYLSAGFGAAALQLFIYHFQFNSVLEELMNLGYGQDAIDALLNEGKYNISILNQVSEGQLSSIFNSYNASMVGASGALYGVLVAFAMLFPNSELYLMFIPVPIKAKYLIPFMILGDLFFGFTSFSIGPIAHFAHLGGAITGFIMMRYWKKQQFNNNRWDV